jgi:hypothetical protein
MLLVAVKGAVRRRRVMEIKRHVLGIMIVLVHFGLQVLMEFL